MDHQTFKRRSDHAIEVLQRALAEASDEYGFDSDVNNGALTIEFDDPPAKFVVSPQAATSQIWVSAHSKSFKLDWDDVEGAFVLPSTGQTLRQLIEDAISKHMGQPVEL
jgi:iron donor protein CyaY